MNLYDETKTLALLVNCRLSSDKKKLLCGAAVFRGGLTGVVQVGDGKNHWIINIPDSVAQVATYQVLADSQDFLEFSVCAQ